MNRKAASQKKPIQRRRRTGTPEFCRILVATDFSELSRNALPVAIALARKFGGELSLLHVVPAHLPAEWSHLGLVFAEKKIARNSLEKLNAWCERELQCGLRVNTAVAEGDAALEIARFADKYHADLIVLASHGYGGWKHLLLGSTAQAVLRAARCPVLVVPAREGKGRQSQNGKALI